MADLEQNVTDDRLREIKQWCEEREASKPHYTMFGDSPKMLMKCDFMIALITELIALRQSPSAAPVAVKVEGLEWIEAAALNRGRKLVAIDCFGNEFARIDLTYHTKIEVEEFKAEREADYERRILSAIETPAVQEGWRLSAKDVEWVVNDIAELGVKIGDQFFFLYKGESLVYGALDPDPTEPPLHEDGGPMHWRPVFKREFGECAHPINYKDLTRVGTVSLGDSDEWMPLPAASPTGGASNG